MWRSITRRRLMLIKAGADRSVNVEAHGWTPLALALNRGHRRMWPLLLRAGAEIPGYYSPMPNPHMPESKAPAAGSTRRITSARSRRLLHRCSAFPPSQPASSRSSGSSMQAVRPPTPSVAWTVPV